MRHRSYRRRPGGVYYWLSESMRCRRKLFAVVLIAIFAFAVATPGGAAADLLAFLAPVWLEFQPDVQVIVAPVDSIPASEQPFALRSLAAFRGPPAVPSA